MLRSLQILDTSVVFYDNVRCTKVVNKKQWYQICQNKVKSFKKSNQENFLYPITDFKVKTESRILSAYIYLDKNDKFFNGKFLWSMKTTYLSVAL